MSAIYADPVVLWERVLDRVSIHDVSGCWEWLGARNSRGYGCVASGKKGKNITTHRLAVMVRDGSLADDMTVDHLCHDAFVCQAARECPHRRCVNPDHLAVVTSAANTRRSAQDRRGVSRAPQMDGPSFDMQAILDLLFDPERAA